MSSRTFILRTAWRESRRYRWRLLLFVSSIILGVAALVSINAFHYQLKDDIERQSTSLLGADVMLESRSRILQQTIDSFHAMDAVFAEASEMLTMSYLPAKEQSAFVYLKAITPSFPLYGQLNTHPMDISQYLDQGGGAIVDDGLMQQHRLEVGDTIRIGRQPLKILGRLMSDFGAGITSAVAPSVYILRADLDSTGLNQIGALITHKHYARAASPEALEAWNTRFREEIEMSGVEIETIADRKAQLREAFTGLNYFLNLVGLVALLLGCIGVGSSVLIYVKDKVPIVAMMRCMGFSSAQAFAVFFIQLMTVGVLGAAIGAGLGMVIQRILPVLLADFLPVDVEVTWQPTAMVEGFVVGILSTLLFALLPMIRLRQVSPLRALRMDVEPGSGGWGLRVTIYALILLFIAGYVYWISGDGMMSGVFVVAIVLAFGVLWAVARATMWMVKMLLRPGMYYPIRQGLSNLFRPNNQTTTLLMSVGSGTAILSLLFITQLLILNAVDDMDAGQQPNVIMYGIGSDQLTSLQDSILSLDMPIVQRVPVVTMRLAAWAGHSREHWLADTSARVERWAVNRESRVTYRAALDDTETLLEGDFVGRHEGLADSIQISLDRRYAEALGVSIGDEMVFDVQGVRMKTYVSSLRKIDFSTLKARFLILFPEGVLEDAPQFHVVVTKSPSVTATGQLRHKVASAFPNVSMVDLSSILKSLTAILDKISYVLRFMAFFCLAIGALVLLNALLLTRMQRMKEFILLRTLGATGQQIRWIAGVEYAVLGFLSAVTGVGLAFVGSYLLATLELEVPFYVPWQAMLITILTVTLVVFVVGLLNTQSILRKLPRKHAA